jgi:hypothetical protein
MTDNAVIGIDLNGLLDAAAFDLGETEVTGGDVPSVVLASVTHNGAVKLTAGREATNAIEGRGWDWPLEARKREGSSYSRIPVAEIIDNLERNINFKVGSQSIPAGDMMAASVEALAQLRTRVDDQPVVIAIPDDGRFKEDAQQGLINAIRPTGMRVHLLWRSVATVLGMTQDLNPHADTLDGHDIAVISLLEDGISVNRMTMTKAINSGMSYIVPKRLGPGRFFPFGRRILDIAMAEASKVADNIGADPWQIMWGDGLPLRWLLHLPDRDAILQTESGWTRVSGERPEMLDKVEITDEELAEIDEAISDVQYVIYEGPALESPAQGELLVYRVREYLMEGTYLKNTGNRRHTLAFVEAQKHNAARGCVEFGRRQEAGEKTYLDHLPQLELAVRQGEQAIFLNLIPNDAECMGGEIYEEIVNLDFSIPAGSSALNFYLLRDGSISPRYATEEIRISPTQPIPIRVRVNQVPAQGRAKLIIEAHGPDHRLSAINVNWDRMEVLDGETKDDVIQRLEHEEIKVPPVQPHPCHSFLWTFKPRGQLLSFSLKDRIEILSDCIDENPTGLTADKIREVRENLLSRYQSPSTLTRHWREDRHHVTTRSRAVSTDGGLPKPNDELPAETLRKFDAVMEHFGDLIENGHINSKIRNQIVTFCAWSFLRCPQPVRDHLREAAEAGRVKTALNDFYAMGRSFSTEGEVKAFFALLISHAGGAFKMYHANSLFYLLSLREDAPLYMTTTQAREITKLVIARLEQLISVPNYKAGMRMCLKALGGLIRFRLVERDFLNELENLGAEVRRVVKLIIARSDGDATRAPAGLLAEDVLTVLEERGVPDTILQWEGEDDGEG